MHALLVWAYLSRCQHQSYPLARGEGIMKGLRMPKVLMNVTALFFAFVIAGHGHGVG